MGFKFGSYEKRNGEIHLCVDFRDLNQASLKQDYPLANMESLLQ